MITKETIVELQSLIDGITNTIFNQTTDEIEFDNGDIIVAVEFYMNGEWQAKYYTITPENLYRDPLELKAEYMAEVQAKKEEAERIAAEITAAREARGLENRKKDYERLKKEFEGE